MRIESSMLDSMAAGQKKYWDAASTHKDFTTTFQMKAFRSYVEQRAKILDIGCGYGRSLEELYQEGYPNLVGMDFSEGMVRQGKLKFPYLDLRVMNDEQIDLPDGSVDAVLLVAVLTCIADDSRQNALIREISRVLKPSGIFYVNDFLLNSDERNLKRYKIFSDRYEAYGIFESPGGGILRHHDEQWINKLLGDFSCLESKKVVWRTMSGHKSRGFYFIGRKCADHSKEPRSAHGI